MGYARFRTGANQVDEEGREIAKVLALEAIGRTLTKLTTQLEEILIHLKGTR